MIYVLGNGGGGLNFEIVGGTTQPSGGGDTLTWDGNTEGRVSAGDFYKVSDATPTLDAFSNGCVLVFEGTSLEVPYADVAALAQELGCVCLEVVFVIPTDNFETSGMTFPEKGAYFLSGCSSLTIPGYTGFGGKPIKENTIWVNTDAEITGWELGPAAPASPTEGMVWIRTGESGETAFSVLKKENVMVNPIRCDQYIDGVWTAKSASIYQAGEWKPFQKRLYWLGSLETELSAAYTSSGGSMTTGTDSLTFTDTGDAAESWWRFGFVLDGTYKTLNVNITSNTARFDLEVRNGTSHTSTKLATTGSLYMKTGTFSLDVSSITNGYVFFLVFLGTATVNKLWLE